VEEFQNNIVITFSYEDYQGDLGEMDADAYSVRIKDNRLSDYDWYHIPPMTPEMQELHIKGNAGTAHQRRLRASDCSIVYTGQWNGGTNSFHHTNSG